ncbi:hypothetical protein JOD02_001136 [Caldicoprobacter guelmensis]|uniref:hypothetical protein n=1 Tax=Caldicoprobacter guelmensis TaxID=1170224 RepID=UPI00195A9700|nr:hypothetical protein [Caldicoprobacter guelmensis]MBM7582279.1 hypothetical protein [Caldicoprobacter guelmensis]
MLIPDSSIFHVFIMLNFPGRFPFFCAKKTRGKYSKMWKAQAQLCIDSMRDFGGKEVFSFTASLVNETGSYHLHKWVVVHFL